MIEGFSITEPGIYENVPAEDYHADPCPVPALSSSLAKLLLERSPLHAWVASPRLNPEFEPETKDVFDIGTACHTLLTGTGAEIVVVEAKDWRTKAAKEAKEAAHEAGKTPLLRGQYDRATEMMEAIRVQVRQWPMGDPFERASSREVVAVAVIDDTWCRARGDFVVWPENGRPGEIWDFKTTTDASPMQCRRSAGNFTYHVQAAHYRQTFAAAHGGEWVFYLPYFEKTDPYLGTPCRLSPRWEAIGDAEIRRAREVWRRCVETNTWPGYPTQIVELDPPGWLIATHEDREGIRDEIRRATGKDVLDHSMNWQAPVDGQARAAR